MRQAQAHGSLLGSYPATRFSSGSLEETDLGLSVARNGGSNLLRPGRDGEAGLGLDAVLGSLFRNARSPAHVFVRGVGAGADQSDAELNRPLVVFDGSSKLVKEITA